MGKTSMGGAISAEPEVHRPTTLCSPSIYFQLLSKYTPRRLVQNAQKKLLNFVQNSILQFALMCDIIISTGRENAPTN